MDESEKVDPKDAKVIKLLMLPGFFAFVFLGLISKEKSKGSVSIE